MIRYPIIDDMDEEPDEGWDDPANYPPPTELRLSADGQWLRVTVDGKQVVTFHVNYVNKILKDDAFKHSHHEREGDLPF